MNKERDKNLSLSNGVDEIKVRDLDVQVIKIGIEILSYETNFNNFEKIMLEKEERLKNLML